MRKILLIGLLLASAGLRAACPDVWQSKPLIAAINDARADSIYAISHPDIELVLAIDAQAVQRTPSPLGIAAFVRLPGARQHQLCIYPRYQHKIDVSQASAHLQISQLPASTAISQVIDANALWEQGSEASRQQATVLYRQLLLSPDNIADPQIQQIKLLSLYALLQQFDFNSLALGIALMKQSSLPPPLRLHLALLEAQVALHDNQALSAIVVLEALQDQIELRQMPLNLQIEWHLLLSTAYFDHYQRAKGQQQLVAINNLISSSAYQGQISNRLLANYYDNLGHLHLTNYYAQTGQPRDELYQAIEQEYAALAVAKLADDRQQQINIHSNLGWLYKSAWRLNSAIRNYLIALSLMQEHPDAISEFYIFRNLALTYMSLGAYDKANDYLQKIHGNLADNTPLWAAKIQCLLGTTARELGDLPTARARHQQCVNQLTALASDINELSDARIELATTLMKSAAPQALPELAKQIEQAQALLSNNDIKVKALLWLANYRHQQLAESDKIFAQVIQQANSLADPTVKIDALIQVTLAALDQHSQQFEHFYSQASDSINLISQQLDIAELGPAWAAKIDHFYQRIIASYIANGQISQAFELLQQARTQNRGATGPRQTIRAADNPALSAHLKQISQLALNLTAQQADNDARLKLNIQRDLLSLYQNTPAPDQVLHELNWYQRNKADFLQAQTAEQLEISLPALQQQLKPAQKALVYFETEQHLSLFTLDKQHLRYYSLGPLSAIKPLVAQSLSVLTNPERNPWPAISALSEQIIPAQLGIEPHREWLISASSSLTSLPFAALLTQDNNQQLQVLIEQHSLTQIDSLHAYLQANDAPALQSPMDFVFFGDPVTGILAQPAANQPAPQNWSANLMNLSWASYEAQVLQQQFSQVNNQFYLQEHATRENLLQPQVLSARVLHIATHSYFDPMQADNVGFALSTVNHAGQADPGFVTFAELFSQPFQNQLVVINGCETAMGQNRSGIGLQGIARGFMVSGAQQVVATLWPISDKASALLMGQFYQQLMQARPVDAALRYSQLVMYQNLRYKHPYYWAAYNLYSAQPAMPLFGK